MENHEAGCECYCCVPDPWFGDRLQEHLDTEGTDGDYVREAYGDADFGEDEYEEDFTVGGVSPCQAAEVLGKAIFALASRCEWAAWAAGEAPDDFIPF